MSKRCEVDNCTQQVPTDMLMCRRHWFLVPKDIRDRVWAGYHRGMDEEYEVAVAAAIDAVREREVRA